MMIFISIAPSPVLAKDKNNIIVFKNGLSKSDIPQYVIDDLIVSNPNADNITIYSISKADKNDLGVENNKDQSIQPMIFPISYYQIDNNNMVKYVIISNELVKDVLQFSLAKGQEMTLTQTYSASLSGSYSGTALNPSNLGVNMTITGSYVKSDKYYGPPESSPNNCRLFKTKFYQERGNYHETYENNLYSFGVKVDNIYTASNYGSYACPTYCYNYSVDIYVP